MILCTEILILLFYYNTKIQKALSTQEPNLWGGDNGGFPSFCVTAFFFFFPFLLLSSLLSFQCIHCYYAYPDSVCVQMSEYWLNKQVLVSVEFIYQLTTLQQEQKLGNSWMLKCFCRIHEYVTEGVWKHLKFEFWISCVKKRLNTKVFVPGVPTIWLLV